MHRCGLQFGSGVFVRKRSASFCWKFCQRGNFCIVLFRCHFAFAKFLPAKKMFLHARILRKLLLRIKKRFLRVVLRVLFCVRGYRAFRFATSVAKFFVSNVFAAFFRCCRAAFRRRAEKRNENIEDFERRFRCALRAVRCVCGNLRKNPLPTVERSAE